jgi:CheY-like chemotaxis protein
MNAKKILLAEDDFDDQQFFYDFLHKREDVILLPMVENGEEVFEYLMSTANQAEMPDAIILDQNMPRQNGLQTLQLLKKNLQFAHIPIVLYSTYADESFFTRSAAHGATLVMAKPATPDGYHKMIDALIEAIQPHELK